MALRDPNPNRVEEAFEIAANPEFAAESVGLLHVSDKIPGYTRKKHGKSGFTYLNEAGKLIKDKKILGRIEALKIPPAWTQVWICPKTNGHLQVTGRDARNRKQYLYHEDWARVRNETKFERMRVFGKKLPLIRRRIALDLKKEGLPRERVLAAILGVMDKTLIRIGNEEYAKANKSYGLTTLRNQHVEVHGATVLFHFRGKSGKDHQIEFDDPKLARVVRKCRDLPGQELFLYRDASMGLVPIGSGDVNNYIREIAGDEFTAKDFRTWGGSVRAMRSLLDLGPAANQTQVKRGIVQAIREAAEHLGNTLSICRKYYIHPCLPALFETGELFSEIEKLKRKASRRGGLRADERLFLNLIDRKIQETRKEANFPRHRTRSRKSA